MNSCLGNYQLRLHIEHTHYTCRCRRLCGGAHVGTRSSKRVETGSFVKLAYTWLNTFDVHLALQGVSNPIGHDIAH